MRTYQEEGKLAIVHKLLILPRDIWVCKHFSYVIWCKKKAYRLRKGLFTNWNSQHLYFFQGQRRIFITHLSSDRPHIAAPYEASYSKLSSSSKPAAT